MGSQEPVVSALMPVHNGERFVEDAVNSILLQTFDDFELIIADDGSTDRTLEIISGLAAKDRRIRLIHNSRCQGISKTLNKAARQARGSLIARMDSDDWAHETRFSLQIGAFGQTANLVLCGSNAAHVDEQMRPLFHTALPISDWDIRCAALFENPFAHPSVMMRAEAFHRAGGYNEEFSTTQDYDLWIRLFAQGEVRNLKESLVKMRRHGESVSARMHQEQSDRTGEIQHDYARQWLGISGWDVSRYRNITRHLYCGPSPAPTDSDDGIRTLRDALKIVAQLEARYPGKPNSWIKRYVIGRCIWSARRRPVNIGRVFQALSLAICRPGTSLRGLIYLAQAAWQNRAGA
jgi:hypothetical protein